jgi:hypothetical protein
MLHIIAQMFNKQWKTPQPAVLPAKYRKLILKQNIHVPMFLLKKQRCCFVRNDKNRYHWMTDKKYPTYAVD